LYQLQNIVLENFEFFIVYVDHNELHSGGWKSSITLKLAISTTLLMTFSVNHTNFNKNAISLYSWWIFLQPCIYKFLCLKSIDVYALGKKYFEK
jgi:hypothetical protein